MDENKFSWLDDRALSEILKLILGSIGGNFGLISTPCKKLSSSNGKVVSSLKFGKSCFASETSDQSVFW